MQVLLKQAKLFDRRNKLHLKQRDVLIEDGKIVRIASNIKTETARVIRSKNLCISPGWLDIGAFNGEPGFEHREDLLSLKQAAAAGGYTFLAPLPNTMPVGDNKSMIESLISRNNVHVVEILPLASSTARAEGVQLAELYDLQNAGAIAFCDGSLNAQSTGQLIRTLEYVRGMNGRFIYTLSQGKLNANGQINEGTISTQLGMVGIPAVEEEINAFKIGKLAAYSRCAVHVQNATLGSVVKQLAAIKESGLTISVPYLNLIFDDSDLINFDVNLKLWPPLRKVEDKRELVRLAQGERIQVINSNHWPASQEEKDLEFGHAAFGATGLETCFRALITYARNLDLEVLVHALSQGSYSVLDLQPPRIREGENAVLTVFDPDCDEEPFVNSQSKSKNNPFLGKSLQGRIIGVVNKTKATFNYD